MFFSSSQKSLGTEHAQLGMTADVMVQDSRGEVQRLIDTFKIAAEEATRLYGELAVMMLLILVLASLMRACWNFLAGVKSAACCIGYKIQ